MRLEEVLRSGKKRGLRTVEQCSCFLRDIPEKLNDDIVEPVENMDFFSCFNAEIKTMQKDFLYLSDKYSLSSNSSIKDVLRCIDQEKIDCAMALLSDNSNLCCKHYDKRAQVLLSQVFGDNAKIINLISKGFEEGFSKEQIGLYAKPYFTAEQMEHAYLGFKNGLDVESVSLYMCSSIPDYIMGEMRMDLQSGVSIESFNEKYKGWILDENATLGNKIKMAINKSRAQMLLKNSKKRVKGEDNIRGI